MLRDILPLAKKKAAPGYLDIALGHIAILINILINCLTLFTILISIQTMIFS